MTTMADAAELERLAERCEKATGLDRELHREIALALGWKSPARHGLCGRNFVGRAEYEWHNPAGEPVGFELPPFLSSLDAAMTLVPEGCWQEIKGTRRYLNIPSPVPNHWSAYLSSWNHEGDVMAWGATPALALVAASLRARSTGEA